MADIPKKRGRGRPRKNPIIEPVPAAEIHILEGIEETQHGGSIVELPREPEMTSCVEEEEERVTLASIPESEDFTFAKHTPEPPPPVPVQEAPPPMLTFNTPSSYTIKPSPPDDKDERRELIDKIRKYRHGFDAARALPFNEDMPTDKLRSLLDDIRLSISSRNTSLLFRNGYLTAVKGVELVGSKAGLRCYGLADTLGKSVEVSDLLKEMEAEMGIKYISPWKRLAFITMSTAVVLHGLNARAEILATYKQEPVSATLDSKYKDL